MNGERSALGLAFAKFTAARGELCDLWRKSSAATFFSSKPFDLLDIEFDKSRICVHEIWSVRENERTKFENEKLMRG